MCVSGCLRACVCVCVHKDTHIQCYVIRQYYEDQDQTDVIICFNLKRLNTFTDIQYREDINYVFNSYRYTYINHKDRFPYQPSFSARFLILIGVV